MSKYTNIPASDNHPGHEDVKGISFPSATVDGAFLARATHLPDAIAAQNDHLVLTYSQLAYKACLVAAKLRELGTAPGDRVCILCERNADSLAAALGVLIAGAIYVPISPDYPSERIAYIVNDCAGRLVIVDGLSACTRLPSFPSLVLQEVLDNPTTGAAMHNCNCLARHNDEPGRAAYILYTSGSTGRPKGVVVPHSALMNTFAWMTEAFGLSAADGLPQKTPWGFTDSLWEMFLPLCLGGRVHFISDETVRCPTALYRELREGRAAITQFVPPALSAFLDGVCAEIPSPSLPSLRWILNGGEELPRSLVDRWFGVFPRVGYANSYGMTESAIYATCYFMRQPPVWGMRRIPVGKPIANAQITILGDNGEVGVPDQVGEICVGGRSLMTGYWGQPQLTATTLILHPKTGSLMYRTGDYGSLRYDGDIAYLGRRDHQIKIRGMRVELGEVERVLMQHPCIKQAAVVLKGEGDAKSLVAVYTVHSEDPGEDALIAHLARMLPSHMVPVRSIKLDEMPVTAHNKTDRARLLALQIPARVTLPMEKATPGSMEDTISRVWANVLGTDDFGIDDGFFAAGGNSLLLVRVYSNLPHELREVLSIPDLLHYPTVRALAARVRESHVGQPAAGDTGSCSDARRRNPAALRNLRQDRPDEL